VNFLGISHREVVGNDLGTVNVVVDVVVDVFLTHRTEDREAYYGRSLPALRDIANVTVNPFDRDLSTPELIEHAAGCQVVVAHRSTPGETELFAALPDLVAFFRCAVDVSTIDIDSASAAGVLVARAGKSFVASTAELALGLLLDIARNISESTVDYRNSRMPPQRPGFQLRGMTAGIIGYGAIGRYLADTLLALGIEVVVHDPHVEISHPLLQHVGLDELLARADVVFPLASSTPETAGLIDSEAIAKMHRGAVLINVSRGELLDESAVAAALDSGHLGGVGIDVGSATDQRPPIALAGRPGVVATPHLGGLTPENADAQAASSVEQVQAIIDGRLPPRSVNPESAARLRGWWGAR